ncbi:hypothetical protein GCM10022244_53990 [Streptomyces gulbargensis]|uniref:Uncharacterized protein n=1 Tax=Streptomyces gulbargensis TaxID=364901 RepID=A0ABP7N7H8_9ACTN
MFSTRTLTPASPRFAVVSAQPQEEQPDKVRRRRADRAPVGQRAGNTEASSGRGRAEQCIPGAGPGSAGGRRSPRNGDAGGGRGARGGAGRPAAGVGDRTGGREGGGQGEGGAAIGPASFR